MKHTPGPWMLSHGIIVAASDNAFIADPKEALASEYLGAREAANARLISASPDLLAACEMILECDGDLYAMDFDMVRAAIAKATGEQP